MQYMDFSLLIEQHSTDFVAELPSEGYWNDEGDFVQDEPMRKTLRGAIIAHRENKIFRSEGKLTGKDKALYMLEPIENSLHGAKIVYEDIVYSIGDLLENSKFTGVWAYSLKYVSAFKKTAPEYDITEEVEDLEQRLDGVLVASEEMPETDKTNYAEDLAKRLDGVRND